MGMTTNDAIEILLTESVEIGGNVVSVARWMTALDVAIKVLEDVTDIFVGKNEEIICGWTDLPCCHCNPGACSNRRYGHD